MISAVIPVWNTPTHELREALDSLRRTKVASEIILVDDHSDNPQTVKLLQEQSERGCKVVMSHHHRSASGARSTGAYKASRPYVLFMDADDTIHGRLQGALAPINLATNNAPKISLDHPLDYLSRPQPLQWGAIIRSDIARHVAFVAGDDDRQEDIGWGYRLFLTAWRDRLDIKKSGLFYAWRSHEGRNTMTARLPQTRQQAEQVYLRRLRQAIKDLEFAESEQIWNWANRKFSQEPLVELVQSHPEARVDVHVLSYSEPWSSLQKTLKSLEAASMQRLASHGWIPRLDRRSKSVCVHAWNI
jgi:glycosyltransferase involved in cell wall biosynthesis